MKDPLRRIRESAIARGIRRYHPIRVTTISLRLSDRLLEMVEKGFRARGTIKSALGHECLTKSLEGRLSGGESTCYDLANGLANDLADSLKRLPRDLATNPEHMDGFGQ